MQDVLLFLSAHDLYPPGSNPSLKLTLLELEALHDILPKLFSPVACEESMRTEVIAWSLCDV